MFLCLYVYNRDNEIQCNKNKPSIHKRHSLENDLNGFMLKMNFIVKRSQNNRGG